MCSTQAVLNSQLNVENGPVSRRKTMKRLFKVFSVVLVAAAVLMLASPCYAYRGGGGHYGGHGYYGHGYYGHGWYGHGWYGHGWYPNWWWGARGFPYYWGYPYYYPYYGYYPYAPSYNDSAGPYYYY